MHKKLRFYVELVCRREIRFFCFVEVLSIIGVTDALFDIIKNFMPYGSFFKIEIRCRTLVLVAFLVLLYCVVALQLFKISLDYMDKPTVTWGI